MIDTIQILLSRLSDAFATQREAVCFYQIGSSVLQSQARDVDILLVDLETTGPSHESSFYNLRKWIGSETPLRGTFDGTSPEDKDIILNGIQDVRAMANSVEIIPSFSIGPVDMSTLPEHATLLHVTGPLSKPDVDVFFRVLPFHGLAFLALNRCLCGQPLYSICDRPHVTFNDMVEWNTLLLTRGLAAENQIEKEKCGRKMLLTRFLFEAVSNPYEDTAQFWAGHAGTSASGMDDFLKYLHCVTTQAG